MSNVAIILTEAELDARIEERATAIVAKLMPAQPAELMTLSQVCELLQLSRNTVRKHMLEGMPHTPVANRSRVSRFKRADVLAWWAQRSKR